MRLKIERKEKELRDTRAAKNRGKNALRREEELVEEQRRLQEELLQLERKRRVAEDETKIAHQNAA